MDIYLNYMNVECLIALIDILPLFAINAAGGAA